MISRRLSWNIKSSPACPYNFATKTAGELLMTINAENYHKVTSDFAIVARQHYVNRYNTKFSGPMLVSKVYEGAEYYAESSGAGNYSYPSGNFTYNGAKYYYSGSGFLIEGVFEDTSGLKRFTVEGANDLAASAQVLLNNYFSYFDEWGKG